MIVFRCDVQYFAWDGESYDAEGGPVLHLQHWDEFGPSAVTTCQRWVAEELVHRTGFYAGAGVTLEVTMYPEDADDLV